MSLHIVCPHCRTVIRVPSQRLGESPRCANCRKALFDGHPVALSLADFDRHLQRNDIPLLVDFWAPGAVPAGPWRRLSSRRRRSWSRGSGWPR
ncbi:hypothetical protein [Methylogaea oryzae]|uniref:hypothetical protein n=1 Tax=Methylogaea oryzae TaxID=1295382 RepID=UPI00402B063A